MSAMFRAPKLDLPKPTVTKAILSVAEVSRVRQLEDWRVVVPTDLPRLSGADTIALTNDIGQKAAFVKARLRARDEKLSANARAQLEMAGDWLDAAWRETEHVYKRRRGADDGMAHAALRHTAVDLRFQTVMLGDNEPIKGVRSFASWLLTGQLWHPNWADAVRARMKDNRRRLVAAMVSMIVPFNVEDPSPQALNHLYYRATGDYLFPSETVPAREIRTADDAIDSLAITFMLPWFQAHGWIPELKRLQRKKGSAFRENPTPRSKTDKPRRQKRRFRHNQAP